MREKNFREIKFRAWDNINSIYVSDEYMGGFAVQNLFYGQGQQYIYQQYTGLKDKNGKEIYEGDILEIGNDIAGISLKAKVEYLDNSFDLVEKGGTVQFLFDSLFNPGKDAKTGKICSTGYVIGNIYENPDLIDNL